jgi:hypothetical protein
MGRAYSIHVREEECIWDLGGKPEGKIPLGGPRFRLENNIKIDLREGGSGLDSSGMGWRPVVGCCEPGNEPTGSIKWWEFLEWQSDC